MPCLTRTDDRQLQEPELELTLHSRSIVSLPSVSVAERFPKYQNGRADLTYALAPGMISSTLRAVVHFTPDIQSGSKSFARSLMPGKP